MFLLVYYLINAQSRIWGGTETYSYFSILNVHNFIGLSVLEWIVLFICVLYIIYEDVSPKRFSKEFIYIFILLLCISTVSVILQSSDINSGFRTQISYLRPLLVFLLLSSFSWNENDISRIFSIIKFIFYLNLISAYIQILLLNKIGDEVSGLIDDAHCFGFLMYMAIAYILSKFWISHKKKILFLIPIILYPTLIASADKMTFTIIPSLGISYLILKKTTLKKIALLIFTVLIIVISGNFLFNSLLSKKNQENISGGLTRFSIAEITLDDISQVRLFEGYKFVPTVYNTYPQSTFIGVGPSMYGSAEVISEFFDLTSGGVNRAYTSSPLKNFAFGGTLLFSNASIFQTGGTSFATSDIIVLLIEFGLIFSLGYFLFAKRLWKSTENILNSPVSNEVKILAVSAKTYLLFIFILAFITFQDGLVKASNIYPFFIIIGMLHSYYKNYQGSTSSV